MYRSPRGRLLLALPLLLFAAIGCGKQAGPGLAPVSGRVLMDNQPLKGAQVRFEPEKREGDANVTPDSYGETDDQGHYTLKPTGARTDVDGAVVGKHHVHISLIKRGQAAGKAGIRDLVPAEYNTKSKLTFTVPAGGTTEANFNLSKK
jgi:hypothetical protein